MAKTYIYLLRHGETVGNLTGRFLGHTDLGLTELGYTQAQVAARALAEVDFCAVYSSDLIRAVDTAKPCADPRGLEVITDRNLRETYFGEWDNQSMQMLQDEFPELFFGGWRENFGTFAFPGGEGIEQSAQRVYAALVKIAKRHEGKTVLAVSHGAVLRALWGKISGIPAKDWAQKTSFSTNASYTVVEYDGDKILPVSFSNDEHLGDLVTYVKL